MLVRMPGRLVPAPSKSAPTTASPIPVRSASRSATPASVYPATVMTPAAITKPVIASQRGHVAGVEHGPGVPAGRPGCRGAV